MSSPGGNGGNSGGNTSAHVYTQEELEELTINEIKEIAEERGYTITETLKADIIAEFLEQQNG
jgi:hypothetical protein